MFGSFPSQLFAGISIIAVGDYFVSTTTNTQKTCFRKLQKLFLQDVPSMAGVHNDRT